MAILTALLSALSRKIGDLITAVMGWSVAALFGRLTAKKKLMVSVAMILSVLWPLFVVGVFFPAAATFVIAFVPVKDLVSEGVLRAIWIALALLAPVVVGFLTYAAAPDIHTRGVLRTVLNGYPLALGFAISFVVTVITVPLIKIASAVRRWSDEHLYVQPKPGLYAAALHDLCEACVWAGLQPTVSPLPRSMAISTKVIKFFARGAIDTLILDEPKMIRADGLELYLYPGDLLLRGQKHRVARVRAAMGRTMLERDAYLVESPKAQRLQDELGRLWEALQRHETPEDASEGLKSRLRQISAESTKPDINYEDWVMVDRIARRIEGKLQNKESIIDRGSLEEAAAAAKRSPALEPHVSPALARSPAEASTVELVEAAVKETRELVRLEVALAKLEAKQQLKSAIRAVIGFATAAVLGIVTLSLLAVAIVLAIGGNAASALLVAAIVLALGAIAGFVGYSMLPKHPFERTRAHLEDDLKQLKEHVA